MKTLLLATTLAATCPNFVARANEAAFSPDGGAVYLTGLYAEDTIWRVDIASGALKKFPLVGLPEDEHISAISMTAKGSLLAAGSKGVYRCSLADGKAKLVAKVEKMSVDGVAEVPNKTSAPEGMILLTGYVEGEEGGTSAQTMRAVTPGGKTVQDVFCRRVDSVSGVGFSPDGHLYFAGNYDLWEGSVEPDEEGTDRAGTLNGCRIAPLAYANTDMANGGSMGVSEVAPTKDSIYVALRGRHMGALLRMKRPEARYTLGEEDGGHPELADQYKIMTNSLKGVEILAEGEISALVASRDGSKIFYRMPDEQGGGQELMLIEDGGEPKKIGLEKRPE